MKMRRIIHHKHKIKPKKPLLKNPIFWWTVLFFMLSVIAIYIFFFWQYLQIKNVIILGNKNVETSDLESLAFSQTIKKILFFDSKSILIFDPLKLSASILKDYPEIDSASSQKKFPQTIEVSVQERQPFAIICGFKDDPQDLCYLMDEKGIIFEETSIEDPSLVLVQQYEEKQAQLGTEIVGSQIMVAVAKIKQNFQTSFNQLNIAKADIVSAERLNILTGEGWTAYFSLTSDIDLQITKLILLLEKSFPKPENRAKLKYIDLRFENKAYYK